MPTPMSMLAFVVVLIATNLLMEPSVLLAIIIAIEFILCQILFTKSPKEIQEAFKNTIKK
jgi:hypothetical protein